MNRILALSILLCTVHIHAQAQFRYSATVIEAQGAILNLDFKAYENIKSDQKPDESGLFLWLDAYKVFVAYKTTAKILDADSVLSLIQQGIRELEQTAAHDPYNYYCQTDLHLFLSYLYFEKSESLQAISHYIKANNLVRKYQGFSNFPYHSKHALITNLVNYLFNQQLGINVFSAYENQGDYFDLMQHELSCSNRVYAREIKLLAVFLFNLQFNTGSKECIKALQIDAAYAKSGPLESLASAIIYKHAEDYSGQLTLLRQAEKLNYPMALNQLNIRYGNALLNQLNDSAIIFLNKFIDNQQIIAGVPYAEFKAALYWFWKGNFLKADSLVLCVKKIDTYTIPSDKQAYYEINHAHFWTPELVQSRLLFDGGNYTQALDVLLAHKDRVTAYSLEQKLEFSYRLGRIFHKLDAFEQAEKFYQMAIHSELDKEFYYVAYAAYYLGSLYQERGEDNKAEKYFKWCSQMDSPIYKSAIHKKARQALP